MSIPSRSLLTTLLPLTLGACFDPNLYLEESTDEGTTNATGTPAASTTDLDTESAEGNADSTGPGDAPPIITGFTIDGSTTPQELQRAKQVSFDVDATDDVGIERVEIFDGDTLVATATEAPYRTELLLTSADNGSHEYVAIAYDGAGQSDQSEAVSLSVNVVGGELLVLRENIADVYMPLFVGHPRLTVGDDGDVIVTLSNPLNAVGDVRVYASRFSSTLSLLWERTLNPFPTSAFAIAHPVLTSQGELLVGGFEEGESDTLMISRADAETGAPLEPMRFGSTNGDVVFPVAASLPTGDVVLSTEPHVLRAVAPDLTTERWTLPQFGGVPGGSQVAWGILGLDVDGAGNVLLTFVPPDAVCGDSQAPCIRKLSPDGDTLWTRPAAGSDPLLVPPAARFDREGNAISVWANDDQGLAVRSYDPDGGMVESFEVLAGEVLTSIDLAIDPQGNVIVAGLLDDVGYHAWAARISTTGEVLWSQIYDELEAGELGSLVSGVAVSDGGQVYLVGASGISDSGFLEYEGSAWVAEVAL